MNQYVRQFLLSFSISWVLYMGFNYFFAEKDILGNEKTVVKVVKEPVKESINKTDRVRIDTPLQNASMNLLGCKLDFMQFKNYKAEDQKTNFTLLYPEHSKKEFFLCVKFNGTQAPVKNAMWQLMGDQYIYKNEIWDISQKWILQGYKIYVELKIKNISNQNQKMRMSGYIRRFIPKVVNSVGHEGVFATNKTKFEKIEYSDTSLAKGYNKDSYTGWMGIADRYWAVACLSQDNNLNISRFLDHIEMESTSESLDIQPGEIKSLLYEFFVGPKDYNILEYSQAGIPGLDKIIDYGWLGFLTKPLMMLLHNLNYFLGSMALALIVFTILMKMFFLPLTIRAQKAMSAMKALQPHIKSLQEQHKDSPKILQLRMLELYKEHKINPLSGCLPIVLQIVLFFPIYRVLNLLIDMRFAPFYGWITDLSAADPTHWSNLFGLLPWQALDFMQVGLWPILMGLSFFAQQYDANNKQMSVILLVVSVFMSVSVPVCVTIFWTLSNVLTILQTHLSWRLLRKFLSKKRFGYI